MTPLQRLLDIQLRGIDQYVLSRREGGKSWDSIAHEINRKLPNEKPVSGARLRFWYKEGVAE